MAGSNPAEALMPCKAYQADNALRHGHARHGKNGKASPTYCSWIAMRVRCRLKRHNSNRYKDRGIFVCKRWSKFENFLEDMGVRPAGKTLDRKNNDGNYTPGNCRWATPKQQANNRSNKRAK